MPQDRGCGENEKAEEKECVSIEYDRYYAWERKNLTRMYKLLLHNKTSLKEGQKKIEKGERN